MSKVFFHSDWHFNHDFVARTRGFDNARDHDEALIERINAVATKRDTIYVLGDVFMGSVAGGLEKVKRVNATLRLVLGNHDAAHPMHRKSTAHARRLLEVFDSVSLHEQFSLPGGRKVLLSHFPYEGDHADRPDRYTQWRLRDEGEWLIHGHVHDTWTLRGRQLNVGVDKWSNGPVEASYAADIIDAVEEVRL